MCLASREAGWNLLDGLSYRMMALGGKEGRKGKGGRRGRGEREERGRGRGEREGRKLIIASYGGATVYSICTLIFSISNLLDPVRLS